MARKKLKMGAVAKDSGIVFSDPESFKVFLNTINSPITLELACGKAAYVRELALRYPEKFFIGVDIKADRIGYAVNCVNEMGLQNVAFINTRIEDLGDFFGENTVSEIWITFADPFTKPSKANKRLTAQKFLDMYSNILDEQGMLHLKTDSALLYEFTIASLEDHSDFTVLVGVQDLYVIPDLHPDLAIQTPFEIKHLENDLTIKYVLSIRKSESNEGACGCCGC